MSRNERARGENAGRWSAEFDRLKSSGARVNRQMGRLGAWLHSGGNRERVQNPRDGRWHTRSGEGCCGCGRHKDTGHANYNKPPTGF